MPSLPIRPLEVPVAGGVLGAVELGEGPEVVLAIHGITANSRAWLAPARRLAGTVRLLASDLRGRGESRALPAPYGIAVHVEDHLALLDHAGVSEPVVVVGHSLGAYIAARLAADHPDRVKALVLVDGGLTAPAPAPVDPVAFLDAFLGPALSRLRMTFATPEAYVAWWGAHPAFQGGDYDPDDLAAFAAHDLVGREPELRPGVNEASVRGDAAEMFEMGEPAHRLEVAAALLSAPRGLLDEPRPLQPPELVAAWVSEAPATRRGELVPDVNHYTIVFGERGSSATAEAVRAALSG